MVALEKNTESASFANAIVQSAVCLNLRMGAWGNTGRIDKTLVEVEGNKRRMKFTKTLLECPELKAIQRHDAQMRKYAAGTSIPSPFKRGIYLIRQDAANMVDQELQGMAKAREELIEVLCDVLDERVVEQQESLGNTFNRADYPTVDELRESYYVVWYFFDPNPARALTDEMRVREQAKMISMWQEAGEECRTLLRTSFAGLIDHLVERLTGTKDNGKPKVFHATNLENIQEFLQTFDARNLTDDADLASLVQKARALTTGVTPEQLRQAESELRDRVRTGFDEIKGQLDSMMVDQPRRMVSFDED